MSTRYDKRLSEIEKKMGEAGRLPPEARGPHILWADPGVKADFSEIEAKLMRKHGTTEGAKFISISWGSPDERNAAESDGVDREPS